MRKEEGGMRNGKVETRNSKLHPLIPPSLIRLKKRNDPLGRKQPDPDKVLGVVGEIVVPESLTIAGNQFGGFDLLSGGWVDELEGNV